MTKKTYIVESPLRFDGKDYAPGKKVDLEDDIAEPLLEARPPVVKLASGAEAKKEQK